MRSNKKIYALAFALSLSAMQASATEFIIEDGKIIEGNYVGGMGEAGGALYNTVNNVTIQNSTFSGNSVTSSNKQMGDGGAIRNGSKDEKTSINIIMNSTFSNNTASSSGGAISNGGENTFINQGIINTIFDGNKTTYKAGSGDDKTD